MGSDTPVKNEKNEFFHLTCADKTETLTILKKNEFASDEDVCSECNNTLVYEDPDVEEEDDDD